MAYELRDKLGQGAPGLGRHQRRQLLLRAVEPLGGGRLARPQGGRGRARAGARVARHRASPAGSEAPRPGGAPHRAERRRIGRLRLSRDRHRPRARLRRDRGAGARGKHPVGLPDRSRAQSQDRGRRPGRQPGPGGDRRGAGRLLLRPGLRVRLHPRQGAARRQGPRPGADDLRHLRALHRPSRPRRRRRHQGPARERAAPAPHQVDLQRPRRQGRARADPRLRDRRGRQRRTRP